MILLAATWRRLRQVRSSAIIRSMYYWLFFVPIAARLLSAINNQATVQILGAELNLTLSLPFTWQVFYFGALFIVIADVVFYVFCPTILKDYSSYTEFQVEGRPYSQLKAYARELGILDEFLERYGPRLSTREHLKPREIKADERETRGKEGFWFVYDAAQARNPLARYFSFLGYAAGFAALTYVMGENVNYVLTAVL